MNVWNTMFRKDVRTLAAGWFVGLGVLVVIVAAIATASYFGLIRPGMATAVGFLLMVGNVFVLPANLFKGLNKETKHTPSLWLQTPVSGWTLFASKLLSSLLGAILFLAVSYLLALALFHIDLLRSWPLFLKTAVHQTVNGPRTLTTETRIHVNTIIGLIPLFEFYAVVTLLSVGLYIAMWVGLVYMSVQAVKNRLNKLRWLVGIGIVLVATWGLGALEHTALYHKAFGWGQFSALSLLPSSLRSQMLPPIPLPSQHPIASVTTGYIVFDVIIMVILFYLTGRLIDRHVEV